MKIFGNWRLSIRFYRYLFTYIVLTAVLLLVVTSVVYNNFMGILKQETEISSTALLKQVKDNMDIRRREMNMINVQMQANPALTPTEVTDKEYGAYKTIRELMSYKATNGVLYEIVLYYGFKEPDKLFTSQGTISIDTYFERLYKFDNLDKNKFKDLFESIRSPVMYPTQNVLVNGVGQSGFGLFAYPLPNNGSKPYGMVIFLFEEKVLDDMMKNVLKEQNGYVYILNEENKPLAVLASDGDKHGAEELLSVMEVGTIVNTVSQIQWNGEKYSVVKVMGDNGWSYVSAIPAAQFMDKVNRSQRNFNYMTGILLLLGMAMAVGFSVYNYNPLKKLTAAFGKNVTLPKWGDEIEFISDSITKISEENIGLMYKLNSKAGIVKEQLIIALLKGRVTDDDELRDMVDISHVQLKGSNFIVILFLIDDYEEFIKNFKSPMQNFMKFSVINVIEELSLEAGMGYGVELIDDHGVGLVLCLKDNFGWEESVQQLADRARGFFKEYFGTSLTVGIGDVCGSLKEMNQSYLQAKRAAYYRLVRGKDTVIYYKDICNLEESKYRYPLELESKLIMCIKQGNAGEVKAVIKQMIQDLNSQRLSPELVQGICFGIINVMMKTMDEMEIKLGHELYKKLENFYKVRYETIKALEEAILDFSEKLCTGIEEQKKNKNDELRDNIITYIKEHCFDDGLSLEEIGNRFELSPSYITRLFKEQTGYTLKAYIDIHRLNKAKRLLKDTDLKLKEIVREIGYFDETSFIRKFKKSEGITPMHYRNIVKGREQAEE